MDPRARLGLLGCVGLVVLCLERPMALGVLALLCAAPLIVLRPARAWWGRGLLAALTIVWGTLLSQGLFYAEQPRVALISLGPLTLWREGAVYGLAQSLRFLALTLAGAALALSTPPDRMLAALLRLRVPFGLALMAAAALRFAPELARELVVVRQARARRGRPAWKRAPWAWLALEVALLRPVVARCWRRAMNLAESLDARGFDPLAPRAVRRPLVMGARDWAVLGAAAAVTGVVVALRVIFLLYTADLVYVPALRGVVALVRAWL